MVKGEGARVQRASKRNGTNGKNGSFGAHVHVAACESGQAGGHYRNDTAGPATAANDVWLDFRTNSAGQARAMAVVNFGFRANDANAVVVHDHTTDATGAAGPKLACLNVDF